MSRLASAPAGDQVSTVTLFPALAARSSGDHHPRSPRPLTIDTCGYSRPRNLLDPCSRGPSAERVALRVQSHLHAGSLYQSGPPPNPLCHTTCLPVEVACPQARAAGQRTDVLTQGGWQFCSSWQSLYRSRLYAGTCDRLQNSGRTYHCRVDCRRHSDRHLTQDRRGGCSTLTGRGGSKADGRHALFATSTPDCHNGRPTPSRVADLLQTLHTPSVNGADDFVRSANPAGAPTVDQNGQPSANRINALDGLYRSAGRRRNATGPDPRPGDRHCQQVVLAEGGPLCLHP